MSEPTLYPPARPLTVGEVLDLSFRIYRRTFVKCLVFGAFLVVVRWLPNLYVIALGRQGMVQSMITPRVGRGYVPMLLVVLLFALVFTVAITYRQYKMVTGQAIGGELLRALRWLPRMVLISILLCLAGAACMLFVIPAFFAMGLSRIALVTLLLLPLCYVFMRLACTFTAMVVEDTGATESLGRSWELAGGNVLRLTAFYIVAMFLLLVVYVAVTALTALLYTLLGTGDVAVVAAAVGVVTVAAGALASPYYSALALAIFGDLIVRKEGADLAQRITASA